MAGGGIAAGLNHRLKHHQPVMAGGGIAGGLNHRLKISHARRL
jgi:hypothetical protein